MQKARAAAGLQDVRVHDLRHIVGMRLREAGVAQVREYLDALNPIADEGNRTNANLEMLFREKAESLRKKNGLGRN